jgi:nucleoside-diphosphate kinase
MEYTFVLYKPSTTIDSAVIDDFEKSLMIFGIMRCESTKKKLTKSLVETHYIEHKDKSFYTDLVNSLSGKTVQTRVFGGDDVVQKMRELVKLIRKGPYVEDILHNVIHASDSKEAANREIQLHFPNAPYKNVFTLSSIIKQEIGMEGISKRTISYIVSFIKLIYKADKVKYGLLMEDGKKVFYVQPMNKKGETLTEIKEKGFSKIKVETRLLTFAGIPNCLFRVVDSNQF